MKSFEEFFSSKMADPKFRKEYETISPKTVIMQAIIDARKDCGYTQKDLSKLTGIAQSDICKLEIGEGNPSFRTLQRLASGLGKYLEIVFKKSFSDQVIVINSELYDKLQSNANKYNKKINEYIEETLEQSVQPYNHNDYVWIKVNASFQTNLKKDSIYVGSKNLSTELFDRGMINNCNPGFTKEVAYIGKM